MNVRNVTGKSTIPAGVAQFGTVTSVGDDTILTRSTSTAWVSGGAVSTGEIKVYDGVPYINLTGTNTTTAPPSDPTNWKLHIPPQGSNIWIYLPDDGSGAQAVARIKSVNPVIDTEASTYVEQYYCDREIATTGAVAFQLVTGNLLKFAVDNNGGAAGELNGVTFAEDEILNADEKTLAQFRTYQDVVTVDATGTSFYIVEN